MREFGCAQLCSFLQLYIYVNIINALCALRILVSKLSSADLILPPAGPSSSPSHFPHTVSSFLCTAVTLSCILSLPLVAPRVKMRKETQNCAGGGEMRRLFLLCVTWSDSWISRRSALTAAETFNVSAHVRCANTDSGSQLSEQSSSISSPSLFYKLSEHEWRAASVFILNAAWSSDTRKLLPLSKCHY